MQEQRPSGALLLPGCRVEERELEEEDEDEEEVRKGDKEVGGKVEHSSCLVVVRPDGSTLLLRAEVQLIAQLNLFAFFNFYLNTYTNTKKIAPFS